MNIEQQTIKYAFNLSTFARATTMNPIASFNKNPYNYILTESNTSLWFSNRLFLERYAPTSNECVYRSGTPHQFGPTQNELISLGINRIKLDFNSCYLMFNEDWFRLD